MTDMMPTEDAAKLAKLHVRMGQFMRCPENNMAFIRYDLPKYKALLDQYKIRLCNEVTMRQLELIVRDMKAGCWPRKEGLWQRHN